MRPVLLLALATAIVAALLVVLENEGPAEAPSTPASGMSGSPGGGPGVLPLRRAATAAGEGRLELRFLGADGDPLPDVEAALLDEGPTVAGEPLVSGRADAAGVLRFAVEPGMYRWRLLSDLPIPVHPARADGVEHGLSPVSGPFPIVAGETASFQMWLAAGRVTGVVLDALGGPVAGARVRLLHHTVHVHSSGLDFDESLLPEQDWTETDEHGRFAFVRVRPSSRYTLAGEEAWTRKMVAVRHSADAHFRFARRVFDLPPRTSRDLGAITFGAGCDLAVRVLFRDQAGAEVCPEAVFGREVEVLLELRIASFVALEDELMEVMEVTAGREVVLHDLPPVAVELAADEPLTEWPETLPGVFIPLDRDPARTVRVPAAGPVELAFDVVTGAIPITVVVADPEYRSVPMTTWLVAGDGTCRRRVVSGGPLGAVARFAVPAGHYTFFASSNMAGGEEQSLWAARGLVVDAQQTSFDFVAGPGSRLSGRVLDRDGSPYADRLLQFADGSGSLAFKTRTDAEGKFAVGGLPPGWTLFAFGSPVDVGRPADPGGLVIRR